MWGTTTPSQQRAEWIFPEKFVLNFKFEVAQKLRLDFYHIKDRSASSLDDPGKVEYLFGKEETLAEIVNRAKNDEYVIKHHRPASFGVEEYSVNIHLNIPRIADDKVYNFYILWFYKKIKSRLTNKMNTQKLMFISYLFCSHV